MSCFVRWFGVFLVFGYWFDLLCWPPARFACPTVYLLDSWSFRLFGLVSSSVSISIELTGPPLSPSLSLSLLLSVATAMGVD